MMDYLCAKFGDFTFSRFGFIVLTDTHNNFGDRCFAAAGPRLWNTLPLNLRLCECDSFGQFKCDSLSGR